MDEKNSPPAAVLPPASSCYDYDGGRIKDHIRAWFDLCIGGGGEMRAATFYWDNLARRPSYFQLARDTALAIRPLDRVGSSASGWSLRSIDQLYCSHPKPGAQRFDAHLAARRGGARGLHQWGMRELNDQERRVTVLSLGQSRR